MHNESVRFPFPTRRRRVTRMTHCSLRGTRFLWALVVLGTACASSGRGVAAATPSRAGEELQTGDDIVKVLSAKSPGTMISRTSDGGIAVQIVQGANSFYGSSEPLYLLNDVPFRPGPGGALTGVNPYDIESIKVLKGPSDTAMYGVRGANGVILITTKKPGKNDS